MSESEVEIDLYRLELQANTYLHSNRIPQAIEALTEAIEIARDNDRPIRAAALHALVLDIRSKHA